MKTKKNYTTWIKTLAIMSWAFAFVLMGFLAWHLLAPEALGWMTGEQKAFSFLAFLGMSLSGLFLFSND